MNKINSIRIQQGENNYSDPIPLSVLAENVAYNDHTSLLQILGNNIEIGQGTRGDINTQLNTIFNTLNIENLRSQFTSDFNQINEKFQYVTPEMFEGSNSTEKLQAALNNNKNLPVICSGIYEINAPITINRPIKTVGNSKIKISSSFNLNNGQNNFAIIIGGQDNQLDFDVDINIDCNNVAVPYAVCLNSIKRSYIKLRGSNCRKTFFKDVYNNNGANYENYIDINAAGSDAASYDMTGSICALLQSSDNNYNQIISQDFETCVALNTSSTQNINCVHGWLSKSNLWNTSKLILVDSPAIVENNNGVVTNEIIPRLVFNFIYQDTMKYGIYIKNVYKDITQNNNTTRTYYGRIEAYGNFWLSAVNSSIVPLNLRNTENTKVCSFYSLKTDSPSFIKTDFHDFSNEPFSFYDKRTLIFESTINPQKTGLNFAYSNLNSIPMGNRTVAINLTNNSNGPANLNGEATLIQSNSFRRTIQFIISTSDEIYIREKPTWEDNAWTSWKKIYPITVPNITYGIDSPSGGNIGDIYLQIVEE